MVSVQMGGFLKGFFGEGAQMQADKKRAEAELYKQWANNQDQLELYRQKAQFDLSLQTQLQLQEAELKQAAEERKAERSRALFESMVSPGTPQGPEGGYALDDLFKQKDAAIVAFGKDSDQVKLLDNRIAQVQSKATGEGEPIKGADGVAIADALDKRLEGVEKKSGNSPFFEKQNISIGVDQLNQQHMQSRTNVAELSNLFAEQTNRISPLTGRKLNQSDLSASRVTDVSMAVETKLNTLTAPNASMEDKVNAAKVIQENLQQVGLNLQDLTGQRFSSIMTEDRVSALQNVMKASSPKSVEQSSQDAIQALQQDPEARAIIQKYKSGSLSKQEALQHLRGLGY